MVVQEDARINNLLGRCLKAYARKPRNLINKVELKRVAAFAESDDEAAAEAQCLPKRFDELMAQSRFGHELMCETGRHPLPSQEGLTFSGLLFHSFYTACKVPSHEHACYFRARRAGTRC